MKITEADIAALQRLADEAAEEVRELEAERARLRRRRLDFMCSFDLAPNQPMI